MRQLLDRLKTALPDPTSRLVAGAVALGAVLALAGLAISGSFDGASGSDDASATESAQSPREQGRGAGTSAGREPIATRELWTQPGYRILRVRDGSRVKLFDEPGGKVVSKVGKRTEFDSPRAMAVLSREREWVSVATPESQQNKPLWVKLREGDFAYETTKISIRVDLAKREVTLRKGQRTMSKFSVSTGAAGSETPPGRFGVTDVIVGGLNPAYGCCAIALSAHQPDLPEGWIGGDRVAIHGSTGSVGSAESSGCIRAADDNAKLLTETVPLGTPVFVKG